MIAGFFSIAPKLYEEITKPKTILSYSVVAGPTLGVDIEKQRIFSITIKNSGKTPLEQIDVEMNAVNSKIENLSVEKSLINTLVIKGEPSSRLKISRLLPYEKISVSLLATSIAQNPDISINSRSNEILGVEDIPDAPKGKFDTDLFGAALSASSVAIMSLFLATGLRRRGILFAPYGKNKEDILAFISRLSRIDVLSSQFMHQEEKTYVRLADTLYIIAKEIDVAHIDQCVKCLKCPLMCKLIDQSADVVKFHLESLGSAMTDEEYKNILNKRNKLDSVKLRGEIKRMLS